jgi:hypothetical protein
MNDGERFVFDEDGSGASGDLDDRALGAELRAALGAGGRVADAAPDVLAALRPRMVHARRRYVAVRAGVAATALACAAAIGLTVAGAATGGSHGEVKIVPPAGSNSSRDDDATTVPLGGHDHGSRTAAATGSDGTGPGGTGATNGSSPGGARIVTAPGGSAPPQGTAGSGTTPGGSPSGTLPTSSPTPTTMGPPSGSSTTTTPPTTTSTTAGMQTATYDEPHHNAGSVTLSWDAHHIVVDSVDAQPGWTYSVHYDDPDEVHVTFKRATPLTSSTMQFQIVGGTLVVDD